MRPWLETRDTTMAEDKTMAGDATMSFIVGASEDDVRRYQGRRWWHEVTLRPDEGVAVVAGDADTDKGHARQIGHGEEEEDRQEQRGKLLEVVKRENVLSRRQKGTEQVAQVINEVTRSRPSILLMRMNLDC